MERKSSPREADAVIRISERSPALPEHEHSPRSPREQCRRRKRPDARSEHRYVVVLRQGYFVSRAARVIRDLAARTRFVHLERALSPEIQPLGSALAVSRRALPPATGARAGITDAPLSGSAL